MKAVTRAASQTPMALRAAATRHTTGGARRMFRQGRRPFPSSTASTSRPFASATLISSFFIIGGAVIYSLNASTRLTLAETPAPNQPSTTAAKPQQPATSVPTREDYQNVYTAIATKFIDEDDYDDGSYAPVVLRLGWHSSGSYDAATNTGGSNGATMRFPPEGELPANSGLRHARDFLASVKDQFPWISYSDLWTLAAVCAVQEMQGPTIPWRPGRTDRDVSFCSPDGRLPDGSRGEDHVRKIFGRMGFDDQEMVALIGAHAVGRCHVERSGFDGPWTFSPITFTNEFYRLLLREDWKEREWDGNRQFQDRGSRSLMMLPSDYCLLQDGAFRGWVEKYAADQEGFFDDFSRVMVKLLELGVPFAEGGNGERMEFERME